jgi:Mrp family chromosome partitioning ATPase
VPPLGVVRTTQIPNFFVIPAGPMPPNPVELLSGPKFASLLAQLGERSARSSSTRRRCWALRTRSCWATASARAVRRRSGVTRKAHARAALKRLRQANVHPLGAVMTKLNLRDGMYGYESAFSTTTEHQRHAEARACRARQRR